MNYIYDIVLNFNDDYYDFFEWKKNDGVINIRKIPLFKVSKEDYLNLRDNDIKIKNDFINKLENITLTYSRIRYDYACLVSNGKQAMGLLFNKDGLLIKRSGLLLDEEEEVIEETGKLDIINIEYIINNKIKNDTILRVDKEKKEYIKIFIENNDDDKIFKYIYYDYYEQESNDVELIKKTLLMEINKEWDNNKNRLYELILLMNKIKN